MSEKELLGVRGIGPATAKRLVEAGFDNVASVTSAAVEKLAEISGFPLSRAQTVLASARDYLATLPTPKPAVVKVKAEERAPEKTAKKAKKPAKGKTKEAKMGKSKKAKKDKKGKVKKDKKEKKGKKGKKGKKKGKK